MAKFFSMVLMAMLIGFSVSAQDKGDTLKEKLSELTDRLNGIDERLMTTETDVAKHNKIKISGYVQSQWEKSENPKDYPSNSLSIRRARLKVAYETSEGVKFVVQPDFLPSGISLKDAYVTLNDRWTQQFSLTAGLFNRPNYEVEYSSSQREVPERSDVIRALYPGERALGAKLEFTPHTIPLKVQLALLNGNDYLTYSANGTSFNNSNRDFDNFKDLMARATYSVKLGNLGGIDFGAHAYFGQVKANSGSVVKGDFTFDKEVEIGESLKRSWFGAELQVYLDLLGGMAIKGEYLSGSNLMPGFKTSSTTTATTQLIRNDSLLINTTINTTNTTTPNYATSFSGYYVYLIKNVGKKHQFALRYDVYDPNTDVKGDDIMASKKYDFSQSSSKTAQTSNGTTLTTTTTNTTDKTLLKSGIADLAYSTLTLAWHYYFDDQVRVTLAYRMPVNETVGKDTSGNSNLTSSYTVNGKTDFLDYSKVFPQQVLTLRIQAKF